MEDLGCLVHMPGPDGESWKLYLELAADYGRMTGKREVIGSSVGLDASA